MSDKDSDKKILLAAALALAGIGAVYAFSKKQPEPPVEQVGIKGWLE